MLHKYYTTRITLCRFMLHQWNYIVTLPESHYIKLAKLCSITLIKLHSFISRVMLPTGIKITLEELH